jgi:hypothetical protein
MKIFACSYWNIVTWKDMCAGQDVSSSCCQLDHWLAMIGKFDNAANLFQGDWYLAPRMDRHWMLAAKVGIGRTDQGTEGRTVTILGPDSRTCSRRCGTVSERVFGRRGGFRNRPWLYVLCKHYVVHETAARISSALAPAFGCIFLLSCCPRSHIE